MPAIHAISRRREAREAGGGESRPSWTWLYDGHVLEAVAAPETRKRRSVAVYEVHVADLVIDEETGEILEIHILPDKHEAQD